MSPGGRRGRELIVAGVNSGFKLYPLFVGKGAKHGTPSTLDILGPFTLELESLQ